MDLQAKLDRLLELAEASGIVVRRMPAETGGAGHPGGALVRLKAKEILFLDPAAPLAEQISVAAAALRGRGEVEDRFLPPELRQLIDQAGDG